MSREQANTALALFRGRHEIKFGADYQDVTNETFNFIGELFRGRGFNPNLPGGFATPQDKRVFDPTNAVRTGVEVVSAYAQDRFDVSDRFNLYLGVRMDDQAYTNDTGEEIISSTDFMPRLGATWDVSGGGKVLLKATAGRYYQVEGLDIINREYATKPSGTNQFSQLRWNPATQRYDLFQLRTVPVLGSSPGVFDPYYKDEASLGVDWQFLPTWAFKVRGTWWETGDNFWSTQQFNAAGQVVTDVRNWDDGFREYQGVQLEVNRAFRNNWTLRSNYTLGEGNGNNFGSGDATVDEDDLFEALGGLEVGTNRTDATIRNREGRGNSDRTHNLNIVGLKVFPIGKHSVGLGGYLGFRSGERWGLRPSTTIRHPVSGQTITSTTYTQPRDANQLEDTQTLNLTGHWQFPIKGAFEGRLGVEAVNITDEQEVIGIIVTNGQRLPGRIAFQSPREIRLQVGVTF